MGEHARFLGCLASDGSGGVIPEVPPHVKFERPSRESSVPIGLLHNRRQFRLVYAPQGQTSGYATFNVGATAQVAVHSARHVLLK